MASFNVSIDEYSDGIVTAITLSEPRASTAKDNTSAESIPPLKPISTFLNPVFLT